MGMMSGVVTVVVGVLMGGSPSELARGVGVDGVVTVGVPPSLARYGTGYLNALNDSTPPGIPVRSIARRLSYPCEYLQAGTGMHHTCLTLYTPGGIAAASKPEENP